MDETQHKNSTTAEGNQGNEREMPPPGLSTALRFGGRADCRVSWRVECQTVFGNHQGGSWIRGDCLGRGGDWRIFFLTRPRSRTLENDLGSLVDELEGQIDTILGKTSDLGEEFSGYDALYEQLIEIARRSAESELDNENLPWNGLKRRLIGSSKSAATVSSRRGIGFRRKYGHWPVEKMGFCGRCSTGEKPLEECDIRRGVGGSK